MVTNEIITGSLKLTTSVLHVFEGESMSVTEGLEMSKHFNHMFTFHLISSSPLNFVFNIQRTTLYLPESSLSVYNMFALNWFSFNRINIKIKVTIKKYQLSLPLIHKHFFFLRVLQKKPTA